MRIFVLLAFLGIVASLVSAGVYLMKDQGRHSRMAHALTLRIGLSILLFLFMLLAWRLGWIEATGIPVPA
ncbi:MAG TPA: twin transmembrane helix small protein [Burkholderiaceae bacterium]|nr:twin transmembrane helix small protein [Burkholderiaceae bacterium]